MKAVPMIDPGSDAKKIAVGAINDIAKKALSEATNPVIGGLLGPVIGEDLVDLLGLGHSTPDYTAYLQNIENGIAALQAQVQALQQAVVQIQRMLGEALDTVRHIEAEVIESELLAALRSFLDHSAVIRESFATFLNAVAALTSAEPDDRAQAATDLFQLYTLSNLQTVAVAMAGLRELVNPSLAGSKGLPELHLAKLGAALAAGVPDDANFATPGPFGTVAWGADVYPKLEGVVVPELDGAAGVFQAFVQIELQGLILLTCGWANTIQGSQVVDQVQALNAALTVLGQFGKDAREGTGSFAGIEPLYRAKLTALVTGEPGISSYNWPYWSMSIPRLDGSNRAYPFGPSWLGWSVLDPDTFSLTLPGWADFVPYYSDLFGGARFVWIRSKDSELERMDPSALPAFVATGTYPLPQSLAFTANFLTP